MTGIFLSVRMSDDLSISFNELKSLLCRVFEGIYGHQRDNDALADQIIWLECHGLKGVEACLEWLHTLNITPTPQYDRQSNGFYLIQGFGACLLELNDALGDLALARARLDGSACLQIESVVRPDLILPVVNRLEKTGLFALAYWWDHQAYRVAFQGDGHLDLQIGHWPASETIAASSPLNLWATTSEDALRHEFYNKTQLDLATVEASSNIANGLDERIDSGFPIPRQAYATLCDLATAILVKASEQSRRGAGD